MTITVHLVNQQNRPSPSQAQFQSWVDAALGHIDTDTISRYNEVNIAIVDKQTSSQLNQEFRNKPAATNVLSFPAISIPGEQESSLGDLAICADTVEFEAQEQCIEPIAHWAHLTVHGILHLLEYDHITKQQANKMEQLEKEILNTMGYDNPYKE